VGVEHFYALSYMWYSLFGILNTLAIGMTASLIFSELAAVVPRQLVAALSLLYSLIRRKTFTTHLNNRFFGNFITS